MNCIYCNEEIYNDNMYRIVDYHYFCWDCNVAYTVSDRGIQEIHLNIPDQYFNSIPPYEDRDYNKYWSITIHLMKEHPMIELMSPLHKYTPQSLMGPIQHKIDRFIWVFPQNFLDSFKIINKKIKDMEVFT